MNDRDITVSLMTIDVRLHDFNGRNLVHRRQIERLVVFYLTG